jgi:hypothetical protein
MLFPPQGHSAASQYPTPFQSIGGIGVNNLTAKMVLALFPPGAPFFKFSLSPKAKASIKKSTNDEADGKDVQSNLEAGLGLAEKEVTNELEQHGSRIGKTEAIQQAIVGGNCLVQVTDDNHLLAHHLEDYVCRRDVDGHPIEIIIRQTLKRQSLPDEAQDFLFKIEKQPRLGMQTNAESAGIKSTGSADQVSQMEPGSIELFTHAIIKGKGKQRKWHVYQELLGHRVPGTDATWPLDTPAFIPLCWRRIQGEDYGRGFVEGYQGDLNSLESLSQTLVEGAAISGQVKIIVDETGLTKMSDITDTPNGEAIHGEVVDGKPKNVGVLQIDKQMDFQFLLSCINKIEERLNTAFLKVAPREAERVTAEEIRQLAKELEAALGGAYAIFAQEFQRPLVRRVVLNMQKKGALKHWPKDMVRSEVVAGLEGLGREQEAQRMTQLINALQPFGPGIMSAFNVGTFITRFGTAFGIDMTGLAKSDQQQQQEAQAAQMADQQKSLGPHMIKAADSQAKDMRAHPDSPVDKQPGGAMGAVQAQAQGQVAPHALAGQAGGGSPPGAAQ